MLSCKFDTPRKLGKPQASGTTIAKVPHAAAWHGSPVLPDRNIAWTATREAPPRVFRSMIFADFADYSRLRDWQVAGFLELLAEVGGALDTVRPAGSYVRTVGDGIFAVMRRATEVIDFALTLNRAVEQGNLSVRNLDVAMRVRIALHAGPIILARDPVAKTPGYYGSHVNRAARLEQVTAPGHIYATSEFVECLKREARNRVLGLASGGARCVCEYFGVVTLAKNFGTQDVYEVRDLRNINSTS